MSLKTIINKAAQEGRAARKTDKPPEDVVDKYYKDMDELRTRAMPALFECLEKLKALPFHKDNDQEKFYFKGGHHFQPGHFRFDVTYGNHDPDCEPPLSPFYHDIRSFVIVFNQQGALAGREAIDEMKGRYHITQDVGMRATLKRLAAWAAYKAPHQEQEILLIFKAVEKKYGLSQPSKPGRQP